MPPRRTASRPLLVVAALALLVGCARHEPEEPQQGAPSTHAAPAAPTAPAEPIANTETPLPLIEPVVDELVAQAEAVLAPRTAPEPLGDVPAALGVVERIAFGSCAHQNKPQPIWQAILDFDPQLFLMIGDNVYADTVEPPGLRDAYDKLAAQPGFRALREVVPVLATWDDHDYGTNDLGGEHPNKALSQAVFLDFFPAVARAIEADTRRAAPEGIYTARTFGPPGQRVQLVLLDTRYFRSSPLRTAEDLGLEPPGPEYGPYVPLDDPDTTMIGEAQWRWLESTLEEPAEVRLIVSSIQVIAEGGGWEAWSNLPHERARLIELVQRSEAQVVALLSGDMHWAELSVLEGGSGAPLAELTSSGLTEAWHDISPNRYRHGEVVTGANFGTVEIVWGEGGPQVTLSVRDAQGNVALGHTVAARPAQ